VIQAIIYSVATGRVRRVIDPQANVPNVIQFLARAGGLLGEAVLVYTKIGQDDLNAWQAAVNAHTGRIPANDRYCIIDQTNAIVGAVIADPSCGDGYPNCILVAHPTADSRWTFTPPNTFVAPPPLVKGVIQAKAL